MTTVRHALYFDTEFKGEYGEAIVATYSEAQLKQMLESMLKDLVVPALEPLIEELNESGSWAILKVVKQ